MKISREILKRVDQLVKANDLEKALYEVRKAREIDPKNLYAFAYEERIQELFAQRQKQEALTEKPLISPDIVSENLKPYNIEDQLLGERAEITETKVPALYEEFKKVVSISFPKIKEPSVKDILLFLLLSLIQRTEFPVSLNK